MIIWLLVLGVAGAGLMVPTLAITSTRWFCANGCHKVQDDTIIAYERSVHKNVSCLACHMPVENNAVVFMLHKMEAVGEIVLAVTNSYTLPLNGESELALEMPIDQCPQCHNVIEKPVSPRTGYKIDHEAHVSRGIACTVCHNRAAHKEDFEFTLFDPRTGKSNHAHADFMTMTACFRCHSQEPAHDQPAGTCSLCHSQDFHLKPASHSDRSFPRKGHAELAAAEESRTPWLNSKDSTHFPEAELHAALGNKDGSQIHGLSLKTIDTVNLCSTCHARAFCTSCHGTPMPHPRSFVKSHGSLGRVDSRLCTRCHGSVATFCGDCHHGSHLDFKVDPRLTWKRQHPVAVDSVGPASCVQTRGCHSPVYCAKCHVNGGTPRARAGPT
jgi:hypothetical protein